MIYAEYTVSNRNRLIRLSHRLRYRRAISHLNIKSGMSILDYGCGDGYLLVEINKKSSDCLLSGYEPDEKMFVELSRKIMETGISVVTNLEALDIKEFDIIVCLEVLEHLGKKYREDIYSNIKNLLKKSGYILISVPVEIGFSAFLKNLHRFIFRGGYYRRFKYIFNPLFSRKIIREENEPYITSHIGFDYRDIEKELKGNFKLIKKEFSPFHFSGGFLNSQVLYILKVE